MCVCVSERVCAYVRVCVRVHFFVGVSRYHQLDWIRYYKCDMTNGTLTLKIWKKKWMVNGSIIGIGMRLRCDGYGKDVYFID
jgi:hypothetical protein